MHMTESAAAMLGLRLLTIAAVLLCVTEAYMPLVPYMKPSLLRTLGKSGAVEYHMALVLASSGFDDCATLQQVHRAGLLHDDVYREMLKNNARLVRRENRHTRQQTKRVKVLQTRALLDSAWVGLG